MHEPILTMSARGGTQKRYRFPNNYGASVVKHKYSYGGDEGLWELAVLAMTRMLLTEENEMFIKHQYSGVCLSSDFTMTYYACTPDYCCIFTYMNL